MSKQAGACDEVIHLLRSTEEGARLDDLRCERGISVAFRAASSRREPLAMVFNPASSVPRDVKRDRLTIYLSPDCSAEELVEPLKREIRNLFPKA